MREHNHTDVAVVFFMLLATVLLFAILINERIEDSERAICIIDPVAGERLRECDGPLP